MALPGPRQPIQPMAALYLLFDAGTYTGYRRLKSPKIAGRTQPNDTSAVRTAIPFEEQRLSKPIEKSLDISMSPQSRSTASGAFSWLWKGIFSAQVKKLLEDHRKKDYHCTVL